MTALGHYLEDIRVRLRLELADEKEVITELETHVEDRLQELREAGLSEEEAVSTCVKMLGAAGLIASRMYESRSQGSWKQALMASAPHLLFSALFVLNWWQSAGWLAIVLLLTLGTAVYGWWHGKPDWVFPWLGYCLLPVAAVGILLLYLPRGWAWVAIPLYIPLAVWWLYYVLVQTVKRDWLLSTTMLLPVPVIAAWAVALETEAGPFYISSVQRLFDFAPSIGLSFLALAATVVAFVRLRKRWLRIGLLFTSALSTLGMVVFYAGGRISLPAFMTLMLLMWGLFLLPAILERKVRRAGIRRLQQR
ncbi:MAG: hypothetical protein HYX91_01470 [Chloroflexi bacterium]|nr:hypothetical protein [Chloroflexota bacterium]